jgi:hypothetical protein
VTTQLTIRTLGSPEAETGFKTALILAPGVTYVVNEQSRPTPRTGDIPGAWTATLTVFSQHDDDPDRLRARLLAIAANVSDAFAITFA